MQVPVNHPLTLEQRQELLQHVAQQLGDNWKNCPETMHELQTLVDQLSGILFQRKTPNDPIELDQAGIEKMQELMRKALTTDA